MTITTTYCPEIIQSFNPLLLSHPMPKLGDDSKTLWYLYQFIKHKIDKKYHYSGSEKLKQLEAEFLELYERAKTKEKNIEGNTKYETQRPFYYITIPDSRYEAIFRGLRQRA